MLYTKMLQMLYDALKQETAPSVTLRDGSNDEGWSYRSIVELIYEKMYPKDKDGVGPGGDELDDMRTDFEARAENVLNPSSKPPSPPQSTGRPVKP